MKSINARTESILRRLVRRDAAPAVRKIITKERPEDLAAIMETQTLSEKRRLYGYIDDLEMAADVLCQLRQPSKAELVSDMPVERIKELLGHMDSDDAADVISLLPDEMQERILGQMKKEGEEHIEDLLAWRPDSAGGLMSTMVFKMMADRTCADAIGALQTGAEELTSAHYLYVVDEDDHLIGVISLRYLLVNPPETPLREVMHPDPISVGPEQDQEDVARYVARYDLLSIPVVDEHKRLLGIVTVDDVIDVIREEAAEDMMKMAGISEADDPRLFGQVRRRAGWLLATIFGGICAAEIIGLYEATLAQVAVLAGFIPVIMGMGGNVGIQSATIAVRGLALGHIQIRGILPFVLREGRVGLSLGIGFGIVLLLYGSTRFEPMIGVAIGTSIVLAILLASILGAGIPVVLFKFGVDPAVAAGPLLTTAVDVLGIIVYFQVARVMLGL